MTNRTDSSHAAGPELPTARTNVVRLKEPATARIAETKSCMRGKSASFVRHIVFDLTDSPMAGSFQPGQSIGVVPPGEDANGKPHKLRLYSTGSPSWGEDGEGRFASTAVKRVIDERVPQKEGDDEADHRLFLGVCSNYLCNLSVGDEVKVTGPVGSRFLLPADRDAHNYLFLATGTGIVPFRAMAKELFESKAGPTSRPVHLVMGSPYTTDLLYDDLFTELDEGRKNFRYHTAISREPRADGRRGRYVDGLIDDELSAFRSLLEDPSTLIYICGLAGMQWSLFRLLASHGIGEGYLKLDDDPRRDDPASWDTAWMKDHVRHGPRCFLEVY